MQHANRVSIFYVPSLLTRLSLALRLRCCGSFAVLLYTRTLCAALVYIFPIIRFNGHVFSSRNEMHFSRKVKFALFRYHHFSLCRYFRKQHREKIRGPEIMRNDNHFRCTEDSSLHRGLYDTVLWSSLNPDFVNWWRHTSDLFTVHERSTRQIARSRPPAEPSWSSKLRLVKFFTGATRTHSAVALILEVISPHYHSTTYNNQSIDSTAYYERRCSVQGFHCWRGVVIVQIATISNTFQVVAAKTLYKLNSSSCTLHLFYPIF